jgi:membrane protease YdiL (CAAX protease family)
MSTVIVAVGLAVAAATWGLLFALGRQWFWPRAAAAGVVIGTFGLVAQRSDLDSLFRVRPVDLVVGVASAAALWGVFWVGDWLTRAWFPPLATQVGQLYALRERVTAPTMLLVLAVVGPAEEIFWRGFVQQRAGVAIALAGYAAVLVWERKPVLLLAALTAGAVWAALFAWSGSLIAPIVSHLLWDLAIMVVFPLTRYGRARNRTSDVS